MKIKCVQRFRPFSHLPGTRFILPGTTLRVQIFPTLIRAEDLSGPVPKVVGEFSLPLLGPVEKFTAMQDLERREISVWGETVQGFMRYRMRGEDQKRVRVDFRKFPHSSEKLNIGKPFFLAQEPLTSTENPLERLSLGNHKLQDWELIQRRGDFTEIFPLWHALGQVTPQCGGDHIGTALLLEECLALIAGEHPEKILPGFKNLWLAGFEGALSPRLNDEDYQGIVEPVVLREGDKSSPLQLLTEAYSLIRSLFIQEIGEALCFLPALPPAFHCGRLLQARCLKGSIEMEWTKKALRRVIFTASQSGVISFNFFRGEKRCRIRTSFKDPGIQYDDGKPLEIRSGTAYWLDRFQK